jgi:hypothetical protein
MTSKALLIEKIKNKAPIETAQLCLSTHEDGLCYNPERALMIKKQYEKDERDYAIIRKEAPRLLDQNILNEHYVIGYEEANLLEECGFYGIQGLLERDK